MQSIDLLIKSFIMKNNTLTDIIILKHAFNYNLTTFLFVYFYIYPSYLGK